MLRRLLKGEAKDENFKDDTDRSSITESSARGVIVWRRGFLRYILRKTEEDLDGRRVEGGYVEGDGYMDEGNCGDGKGKPERKMGEMVV